MNKCEYTRFITHERTSNVDQTEDVFTCTRDVTFKVTCLEADDQTYEYNVCEVHMIILPREWFYEMDEDAIKCTIEPV